MDINKILTSDILDIIFDGRNKEYGAYDLRKTYNKRITTALFVMLGVCLLIFLSSFVMSLGGSKNHVEIDAPEIELDKFKEEKKVEPPPPPPPPKVEPPKIEVAKFTPPKIVKDEEVKKEDEVKEIKDLEDKKTGTFDQKGVQTDVVTPVVEVTTGGTAQPVEEDYNKVFTHVEIQAEFPGGMDAWRRYLERNLNQDAPKDAGAPSGRYTVQVTFLVDKEGNISDVKGVYTGSGDDYGTVEEAVRAIQKGPRWNPGIQNGIKVKSYRTQPITFVISEE